MKSVTLEISDKLSLALRGKLDNESRGRNYWDAISILKYHIADMWNIPRWKEKYEERTLNGDAKAPVSIIYLKRIKKLKVSSTVA